MQSKLIKQYLKSLNKNRDWQQRGQALVAVLIIVALSSIILVPLGHLVDTGLRTTQSYQRNAKGLYAADAGIQYAIWEIKNSTQMISDRENGVYTNYSYNAPSENNNSISVQVNSNWLFYYLFSIPYGNTPHNVNLMTTTSASNGIFTMNFTNSQQPGGPPVQPVVIAKMGVWLPPGYSFNGGVSGITTGTPTITNICGGTNLVWNNVNYNLGKYQVCSVQFSYTPDNSTPDMAASWVYPQQ
jgi:hypothetical protein